MMANLTGTKAISLFIDEDSVHTTGQSGHAYHPHYIDMAPLWENIQYYSMLWEEENITSNAEAHLMLKPE
jgi:penicillin G amidase